jgi:hypothetical protein
MGTIKSEVLFPYLMTDSSFVRQCCLRPLQRHMATVHPESVDRLSFSGWQGNLRPLLTRDPTVYGEDKTNSVLDGPCLTTYTDDDDD